MIKDKMIYYRGTLFLISMLLFFSCVPGRKLLIVQSEINKTQSFKNENQPYYISTGDILNIKVTSADPLSLDIFNKSVGEDNVAKGSDVFINGYVVNDSGYVEIPIIGKLKVAGYTLQQCKEVVSTKLSVYYKIYSVNVELMNYNITVLGEVMKPSTFTIYNNQTNLLQVIGMAGGLTDYANNERVHILRKEGKDSTTVHYVSVHKIDILKSPQYYVKPNDVIYIEPLKIKALRVNSPTLQIVLSLLTLTVLILNITKQ